MTEDITVALEAMVDKHGLVHVLTGLACVCREKADHLRANWQDEKSAKQWDKDASYCDQAATKVST